MSTLANITSLNLSLQTGGAALAIKAVKSVAKPERVVYVFGTADDVAPNFTTEANAITYAQSLTPISTEPVVIRTFTKADGTPYTLAGLSSWTTYANQYIYFVSDFVRLNETTTLPTTLPVGQQVWYIDANGVETLWVGNGDGDAVRVTQDSFGATASGSYAVATGANSGTNPSAIISATGIGSFVHGVTFGSGIGQIESTGMGSFAGGISDNPAGTQNILASGDASFAYGYGAIASGDYSQAFGKQAVSDKESMYSHGNGTQLGNAQYSRVIIRGSGNNTTVSHDVAINSNEVWMFTINISARRSSSIFYGRTLRGCIRRTSSTTTLAGSEDVGTTYGSAITSVTLSAGTDALNIQMAIPNNSGDVRYCIVVEWAQVAL
jgi:hypothetical protein